MAFAVRLANGRFAKKGTPEYAAGLAAQSFIDVDGVRKAVAKASFESLKHAGASLRITAAGLIKKSRTPSNPGEPMHTKFGAAKKAIMFAYNEVAGKVTVGPDFDKIGLIGHAFEFGGNFRGFNYAARPVMGPALEKLKPRLEKFWYDSVN